MSRYTKTIGNRTLNYGFDHVLGYWFDIERNTFKEDPIVEADESTMFTNLSRNKFLLTMKEFEVPSAHQYAVTLDLEF